MGICGFLHEYVTSWIDQVLTHWKATSYWFFFTLVGFLVIYVF